MTIYIQWEEIFGNHLTALDAAQKADWSFGELVCKAHSLRPELKFDVVATVVWELLAQAELERSKA